MAMSKTSASEQAIVVVAAALQSSSIKLPGGNITGSAKDRAAADGEYLATLVTMVAKAIQVL